MIFSHVSEDNFSFVAIRHEHYRLGRYIHQRLEKTMKPKILNRMTHGLLLGGAALSMIGAAQPALATEFDDAYKMAVIIDAAQGRKVHRGDSATRTSSRGRTTFALRTRKQGISIAPSRRATRHLTTSNPRANA